MRDDAPRKHDHFDLVLNSGKCIRFNDPRRFGVFTWWDHPPENHPLLRHLGPEPLSADFSGACLWRNPAAARGSEKLHHGWKDRGRCRQHLRFRSPFHGRHPSLKGGRAILSGALRCPGRSDSRRSEPRHSSWRDNLRDFLNSDGNPGYFAQELLVYEREGLPCFQCRSPLKRKVIGQRSSYYCPQCQR